MDLIDTIKKDKAYNKFKLIVKNWEKDFKTRHARIPSKFDIKEAPTSIRYAYKKYFQLKSAALENSLSICDFEEDNLDTFSSPEPVRHFEGISGEIHSPPSKDNSQTLLPALPSGQEIELLLSNVQKTETPNPKLLNKESPLSKPLSPFTANLSKKLFESKKFSIRNPRKSLNLSRSLTQSIIEESVSSVEKENVKTSLTQPELNNLEFTQDSSFTLITNNEDDKSTELSYSKSLHIIDRAKAPTIRHFDEAWLKRATGTNEIQENEASVSQRENQEEKSEKTESFGIANIRIPIVEKTNDIVENSESESEDIALNKLKPALKKRKIEHQNVIKIEEKYENATESTDEDSITEKKSKVRKSNRKLKPKAKKVSPKSNKRKSKPTKLKDINNDEQPPDITEYLPFGIDNDVAPRHSKATDILKQVDTKTVGLPKEEIGKLEKKIQDGTLNENFLRINIEKKVFVRGRKNFNFSKYKKQLNKDKKALHAGMEFPEGGKVNCFKCGGAGHMARFCTAHRGDTLLPLENYNENDMPTLEDMQEVVSKETNNLTVSEQLSQSICGTSAIPESFLKLLAETPCSNSSNKDVKPVYTDYRQETPMELYEALQMFGHKAFRPGQEEAIKRILCGMSTLLILSTGGGKSLCYQLPAYIYSQHFKCITLVISPLVSLMEDQVLSMPEFLKAGCLHTNQPPTQREKIVQCLKNGEINILLISPEALISGDGSRGFGGLFKSLPQIAFACIDEAHCVSQWSHNFRPSYLMICRVLREKLNVKCILGLTATASQTTIKSVISHINIPDGLTGVITNPTLPDNLLLSVSFEKDKDRALVSLINSERITAYNSIIVYCIRRDECERVAAILRSCLQQPGKITMEQTNKRKRMSYLAEAYHAGMSAAQRKKIQKHFMDGTLRIIVATVAFGMGINKSDIRCIIHYSMPSSFESYVQEVGRAGRDGKEAYCHVLMNNSNTDKNELLKHIHANTIDRPTIRKLLQKVFIPCECGQKTNTNIEETINTIRCKGHEVGIPIDTTVEELDLPSENLATLLCYVELHPKQYIKVLNNAYTMCKISSYGGPQKILEAAKNCPPLAMAYLLESKRNPEVVKNSILEFNVIEVAAAIGWESGMTKYHLKNLEWISEGGRTRRSNLKIEFNTLGFRIKSPGDLSPTELDSVLDDLHEIVLTQEKTMLYQLEESHRAFSKLGNYSLEKFNLSDEVLVEKSNELKHTIRNYFQRENNINSDVTLQERPLDEERVIMDVRALICAYKDCTFTGRSIARIFQGISSPNYPAIIWGRCKFWRSRLNEDFYGLMKVATQQIIQMKMK